MIESAKEILDGGGTLALALIVWWELRGIRKDINTIATKGLLGKDED